MRIAYHNPASLFRCNIESWFNQWGVELGKALAQRIIPEMEIVMEPKFSHDSSTKNLIRRYPSLGQYTMKAGIAIDHGGFGLKAPQL